MQGEIRRLQDTVNGLRELCREASDFVLFSPIAEVEIVIDGKKKTINRKELAERLKNA